MNLVKSLLFKYLYSREEETHLNITNAHKMCIILLTKLIIKLYYVVGHPAFYKQQQQHNDNFLSKY